MGEPDLLMNLAWSNLHRKKPDLDAADRYAHQALNGAVLASDYRNFSPVKITTSLINHQPPLIPSNCTKVCPGSCFGSR